MAKVEAHLAEVPCPCDHGHDLGVLGVPPGSIVWAPSCKDPKSGKMRPHKIGAAP